MSDLTIIKFEVLGMLFSPFAVAVRHDSGPMCSQDAWGGDLRERVSPDVERANFNRCAMLSAAILGPQHTLRPDSERLLRIDAHAARSVVYQV